MLCYPVQSNNNISLNYIGPSENTSTFKSESILQSFFFNYGDELLYIGYYNSLQSGMLDSPDGDETYIFQFAYDIPCPETPTVEYEGQTYNTVQIMSQCWLKENLNVLVHRQHLYLVRTIFFYRRRHQYHDCPEQLRILLDCLGSSQGTLQAWRYNQQHPQDK